MHTTLLRLVGAGLLSWGGWAAITVRDLPEYLVAGAPASLTFTVRQHGVHPLTGLRPTIEATSGRDRATAAATPGARPGEYVATLTPSDTGEWTITIYSGFNTARVILLPLKAIAPGARAPGPLADAERGRRLFVAKGCVACHLHRDVNPGGGGVGPELSGRHFAVEFLATFLANPGEKMPNLELKPREISALVAFLNSAQLSLP